MSAAGASGASFKQAFDQVSGHSPTKTGGSQLNYLAEALCLPHTQWLWQAQPTSRWRALGSPDQLALQATAPHALHRLHIARAALDHAPEGRWALRLPRGAAAAWLGPRAASHAVQAELDIHALIASWPRPVLLRRLFVWLDGQRVDAALAGRWAGARRDLPLDPPPPQVQRLPWPQPAADAREALQRALQLHAALLSGWRMRAGQLWPDEIALGPGPNLPGLQTPGTGMPAGPDADKPAGALPGAPTQGASDTQSANEAGAAHDSDSADGAGSGGPGADLQAQASDAPLGGSGQTDDGASATGDGHEGAADAPEADATASGTPKAPPARPRVNDAGWPISWHKEWDSAQRRYLPHWTAVHVQRMGGDQLDYLREVRERHAALALPIRRHLLRLEADARLRERRLFEGEHVDLDAVLDERASGTREGRVYQSQLRRTREVSVALLLDLSGSTSFVLPQPEGDAFEAPQLDDEDDDDFLWATARPYQVVPPARRVIDVFKEAAVLMADALHGLGHRFAIWGFSGEGRLQVDFLRFKDFGDGWTTREAAALGEAMPRGYTRMGAAVRHATRLLAQEPARRKLLIVLSDGYPQDRDYGPSPDSPSHGVADTARALREAEQAGVGHFHLSVDAAAHDYLRRMGKPGSYRVVRDVEALPRELLRLAQRLRVG